MLSLMLGWIPVLGPIFQGISSIASSFFSEKTAAVQADASVTIAETQASAQIIQTTNDDICLRLLRDALCAPVVIWTGIIGWDTIVVRHNPDWVYIVEKYPDSVSYLPYAVIVFLLGNIGLNIWKSK